jgi:3-oxoadipate enol-lactonase
VVERDGDGLEEFTELPFGHVPRGRTVETADGGDVYIRVGGRAGSDPPVLLLHGLGATGALNWAGCFEPLAASTTVVALDHRGHGRGRRVGNRFRLADCADDAAGALRTLGLGPAVVVGYSMGGAIAQLLAFRHPDLVAGLVMSATARDFRGRPVERLRFGALGLASAVLPAGPPAFAPPVPVTVLPRGLQPIGSAFAELRRHEPRALVAAASALGRFSSREWIASVDVPASVIVHTQDRTVPARRQYKLAEALPAAEVIEVDIDHLGVVRRPDRYVPALLDAYSTVAGRIDQQRAA